MNSKKIITLVAIILVIIVIGIIVGIEIKNNGETNTIQNQVSNENELENREVAETQDNTSENEEEIQNNQESGDRKALVVYFSHTGNTENVANFIHEAVGGDIVKLETQETYTDNYDELLDIAQEEKK